MSWHVDRAELLGELSGSVADQVRKHVEQAEKLAGSPASGRAVIAQLDNAARKGRASTHLVESITALAATFR